MHSMAIKINVFKEDQEMMNTLLEKAGYPRQKRKYHCTFGFIEKMIPEEEAASFGQKITSELQAFIDARPCVYEVEKAAHLFGHVIAFLPTVHSLNSLKEVNLWLFDKVKEMSEGRWSLNKETEAPNYNPHMTLWRTRRPDERFNKLESAIASHPSYRLVEAAHVTF